MSEKPLGKYSDLSKDPEVSRWLRNLRRGSPITAEVALRRIGRACELLSTDPKSMVQSARSNLRSLQDSLEDLVSKLEEEGKAPGYIVGILKSLRSWLRYNDIVLTRNIKVTNRNATPTIENEQVPTQTELSRILRTSSPRIRVAEALMAFADLRPESIGNHNGTDGLRLKDFPELKIQNGRAAFEKIPTMVIVRPTLSKTRSKYFTFLGEEGCTHLQEYLEERIISGESLTPETPLIGYERSKRSGDEFLSTRKITHYIRTAMRAAGIRKRPYVLRAYAETQLIIAESKGKISHPYLQFIAGHKGDIEARYSTNKGRLPPEMIQDIRKAYQECEPFLNSTSINLDQNDVIKQAKLESLKAIAKNVFGIDLEDEISKKAAAQDKEISTDEELEMFEDVLKNFREGISIQPSEDAEDAIKRFREGISIPPVVKTKFESKLVTENDLEDYLNNGWEMVQIINSKILIRKIV
ncbi:site-specific integrase [Candidatus Bathyarchaeota archaeon]|nr:site-specific integrase [Candidatus Bathyarchaeota archaeon]